MKNASEASTAPKASLTSAGPALTCEFDVVVELAGMPLSERWGNWARSAPFLADSRSNVWFYRPA